MVKAICCILNTKGITFNKTCTFTEGVGSTSGFVQLGHDVEAIIGS